MHPDPLSALLAGKKDSAGNIVVPAAAPAPSPPQQKPIDIDDFFNVEGSLGGVQSSLSPTGGFAAIDSSNKAQASDRAEMMIERALAPSSHVDFPAITEICERVRVEPREAAEAVRLLVSAAEVAPQNPPRRRLKAITILHELVYDELAAAELRARPEARAVLQDLQQTRNSGLGEEPDQQLRMFAAEVERSCWNSAGPTSPTSPLLGGGQALPESGSPSQGPTRKRDKVFGWLQEVGSAAAAAAKSGAEVAASAGSAAVAAGGALMSSAAGGEELPEPLSPGTAPSPVPNVQFEGILAGECVYHVAKKADLLTVNPFCETSGRLLVTNFRLKFQIPRGKLREELQWMQERKIFDIPHGAVEDFKIDRQKAESGVEQFRLRLRTKDQRSLTFLLGDEQEGQQAWRLFLLFAHAHGSPEGLFAFAHAAKVEPTAAGPGAEGWSLYDPQAEYARMGVETSGAPSPSCPWILSDVNQRYELCSTYPAWIVVPRARKELETLQAVASFRKRGRIPVMSWCAGPELDFVSLWRSSQPTEGIMGQICEVDKGYVLSLKGSKSPASSRDLLVVDLRPKKAAWANKANGGGFEDYDGCRLEFGGVGNIHAVRDAWNAMGQAVANTCRTEVGSWLKDVANSGWYDLMSMIMRCASMVIEELQTHRCSTLIHCSDGWDRTAQVSSLAMLCMDPHYRTVSGFLMLVQKEFCSFGHQFRTRLGLGEKPTSEYSPIFPQWLECIYQLLEQFPEAFEFTPQLLLDVGVEALSNRYGTFLTDNERERSQRVKPHTLSCWSALAEAHGGANANPHFQRTEEALRPSFCQVDLKIWQEYWFRYHVP